MVYKVIGREEGQGKPFVRSFKTLAELQAYVRDRWEGPDYIDGPASFHNDYCTFRITGAMLADLGNRLGLPGTDGYWDWAWKDISFKTSALVNLGGIDCVLE